MCERNQTLFFSFPDFFTISFHLTLTTAGCRTSSPYILQPKWFAMTSNVPTLCVNLPSAVPGSYSLVIFLLIFDSVVVVILTIPTTKPNRTVNRTKPKPDRVNFMLEIRSNYNFYVFCLLSSIHYMWQFYTNSKCVNRIIAIAKKKQNKNTKSTTEKQ